MQWLPLLLHTYGEGVVLLQETDHFHGMEVPGYKFCMAPGARVGILVPDSLTSAIMWDSSVSENFSEFSFASSISFGEMGVVCIYFTHAGLPESFMQGVSETRQCLKIFKQKGCKTLMMGCDLNSQLPPHISNITGGAVYNVAQVSHMQRVEEFLTIGMILVYEWSTPLVKTHNLHARVGEEMPTQLNWIIFVYLKMPLPRPCVWLTPRKHGGLTIRPLASLCLSRDPQLGKSSGSQTVVGSLRSPMVM